ncbi:MAG: hypothetical protein Q8N28_02855 [bacterium]|nr:hypothetical protein [bacterium]
MGNIEMLGSPSEQDEQAEQNEQEKISSAEELEGLIGTEVAEIKNYYSESAEDWLKNFKERLNNIEILINSEEAAEFLNKSVLEGASMRARILMENLDNLSPNELLENLNKIL